MSQKVPRLSLVRDLRRVGNVVGHAPRWTDYDERGIWSGGTARDRLGGGSSEAALRVVGFDPTDRPGKRYDDADPETEADVAHECRRAVEALEDYYPTLVATARKGDELGWRSASTAEKAYLEIGDERSWGNTLRAIGVQTLGDEIPDYLEGKPRDENHDHTEGSRAGRGRAPAAGRRSAGSAHRRSRSADRPGGGHVGAGPENRAMSTDGMGLSDDDRTALKDLVATHRKRGSADSVSIEQCREWRRAYASAYENTDTITGRADYCRCTVSRHVSGRCGHEHDTRGDGA